MNVSTAATTLFLWDWVKYSSEDSEVRLLDNTGQRPDKKERKITKLYVYALEHKCRDDYVEWDVLRTMFN
jgi:hypothetical protein